MNTRSRTLNPEFKRWQCLPGLGKPQTRATRAAPEAKQSQGGTGPLTISDALLLKAAKAAKDAAQDGCSSQFCE